jgi:preprotein translocase subunit SecE
LYKQEYSGIPEFFLTTVHGCSSVGRALVSKTRCREFESLLPCENFRKIEMKIKGYFQESLTELLHKVTWPTWSELQNSATLVMVATLIIAVIVAAMDFSFSRIMKLIYSLLY